MAGSAVGNLLSCMGVRQRSSPWSGGVGVCQRSSIQWVSLKLLEISDASLHMGVSESPQGFPEKAPRLPVSAQHFRDPSLFGGTVTG